LDSAVTLVLGDTRAATALALVRTDVSDSLGAGTLVATTFGTDDPAGKAWALNLTKCVKSEEAPLRSGICKNERKKSKLEHKYGSPP
jgi:hypothetical protein